MIYLLVNLKIRPRLLYLFNASVFKLIEIEARTPLVTMNGTRLELYATVRRWRWTIVQKHIPVAFEWL